MPGLPVVLVRVLQEKRTNGIYVLYIKRLVIRNSLT